MSKNHFSQIPTNQPATSKQFFAVTNHLAKIHADDASKTFALTKVMRAIVNNIYDYNGKPTTIERTGTVLTHGKVQELFKSSEVPAEIVDKITLDFSAKKPTVSKAKSKAKPKAKAKTKSVKSKEASNVKPTNVAPSKMSVGDFEEHFSKITGRVFRLESKLEQTTAELAQTDDVVCLLDDKISIMESKLDILMAHLESNPDA
jgi:hypothetical protein